MADAPLRHRNYRIMRVSSCGAEDPSTLLYRDDEGLRCASYARQQQSWLERKIGCGDAFSRAMRSRGHEVLEAIVDLEPVQRTWAWERGVDVDDRDWKSEVLLAQIREFKPEVLFLQGYDVLPASLRLSIKKRAPTIDLLVIHQGPRDATPGVLRELSRADVLFTTSPALARDARKAGLEPQLVYEAFDPSILCELPAPSKIDDEARLEVSFLGTTGERAGRARRERILANLVEEGWLDIYARQLTAAGRVRRGGPSLGGSRSHRVHRPLHGLDYFAVMQRSRVSLNIHCDSAQGFSGNRRMFEATGVGSCLVTDRGSNLAEIFEDGKEVVTFDSIDEAREKIRYLLDHEDERLAIAQAGRARTLADHTVARRVAVIDEWIQQGLARHRKATRTRWRGLPGSLPT